MSATLSFLTEKGRGHDRILWLIVFLLGIPTVYYSVRLNGWQSLNWVGAAALSLAGLSAAFCEPGQSWRAPAGIFRNLFLAISIGCLLLL
jgi:hypothetical protein